MMDYLQFLTAIDGLFAVLTAIDGFFARLGKWKSAPGRAREGDGQVRLG